MAEIKLWLWLAIFIIPYMGLVRILRYRRRDDLYLKFQSRPLVSMTVEEASAIQCDLAQLEFPRIFSVSIFFALFKTYGIPSISTVLAATGQLVDETSTSKRAADTGVLLTEIVLNPPSSERVLQGIARVNFLHNRYRRAGRISNDDMLYTLGLFALEPVRWTKKYDWRPLSDIELCALGVFWRDLGDAMEISFEPLRQPTHGLQDGQTWLRALEKWSIVYEKVHMKPASSNQKVAKRTLDIALFNVPVRVRSFALKIISALLEPQLRRAMMMEEPGLIHELILRAGMSVRRLFVKYLCIPRPSCLRVHWFTQFPDSVSGRYHALQYVAHPWYIKPNLSSRWGLEALMTRLYGGVLPGDYPAMFSPEGYHISELGPEHLRGKGDHEMRNETDRLRSRLLSVGCPISSLR